LFRSRPCLDDQIQTFPFFSTELVRFVHSVADLFHVCGECWSNPFTCGPIRCPRKLDLTVRGLRASRDAELVPLLVVVYLANLGDQLKRWTLTSMLSQPLHANHVERSISLQLFDKNFLLFWAAQWWTTAGNMWPILLNFIYIQFLSWQFHFAFLS